MSKTPLNRDRNSEEIDLKDIIIPIWNARKQIIATALIFAVLGGIIGLLTPATYTATSTFLPQTTQSGGAAGSLGGLAALAGINLNAPMTDGDIPPSMYAVVLKSEPFRNRILNAKIWVNEDSVTYRKYLENQPGSAIGTIQDYTIGLPVKLINLISREFEKKQVYNYPIGFQPLSDRDYSLISVILERIKINFEIETGLITIIVTENNPIIAAQITNVTEKVLQNWISEHKVKNAKAQFDFVSKQFEAKQNEFFSIQEKLANYTDRNQNVLSASYLTRLDRLQAEFDLVNTIYSELAKQKEHAAIQLSKDTPTFSILDPVKIPKEENGPSIRVFILFSFLAGFIFQSIWILVKNQLKNFIISIKKSAL